MKIFEPGGTKRLYVIYQENGMAVTGLTDLTVEVVKTSDKSSILSSQSMTEIGASGEYKCDWNTDSVPWTEMLQVIYKKNGEIISVEEIYFDILEDMDGYAS